MRERRPGPLLALLWLGAALTATAAARAALPDSEAQLEDLIRDASGAPAEFSADLLIRIAASPTS